MHGFRRRAPLLVPVLLWACGGDGDGGVDPSVSVELEEPATTTLTVGETLDLRAVVTGASIASWHAADTAVAEVAGGGGSAVLEARRPGTTEVIVEVGSASDRRTFTVRARVGGYPAASIDYYAEIGFGAEYGNATPVVRRWAEGPRVRVNGAPTATDRATLDAVLADINRLTTTVDMSLVDSLPSVELHFAPLATFPDILPGYVPGNVGYFSVWWDATQSIVRAVVLVATDIDQEARDHIIREEVTQILGLMRDSFRYPESIFQQSWTLVHAYAPIDEDLIAMLYRPELPIGFAPIQAVRLLRRLTRDGPVAASGTAVGARPSGPLGEPGTASGGVGRR